MKLSELSLTENTNFIPDVLNAKHLAHTDPSQYRSFISQLRKNKGVDYSTKVHQEVSKLMKG